MWGEHKIHQNSERVGYRRRGDIWTEHLKKADLQHAELSVEIPNNIIIDLIYGYNDVIVASECLDLQGEE
jgi:hypothetical protein